MVITKFLLVCKTANGAVYSDDVLDSPDELQDDLIRLHANGVSVLDVIPVEIDFSKYEH